MNWTRMAVVVVLSVVTPPALALIAQERVTLTSPILVDPGAQEFGIVRLILDRCRPIDCRPAIEVTLQQTTGGAFVASGKTVTVGYLGEDARLLIVALNKVDLSVKSLNTRIMERLIADGKIPAGTISGAPQ